MKGKKSREAYEFMPKTHMGQALMTNLSWNENEHSHHRQIIDKDGFVFDLDKEGRIIRMTDKNGNTFETKEVKNLFL